MYQVLREHAVILRSQADELDAIADVLEREERGIDMSMAGYEPTPRPVTAPAILDDEDHSSSGLTIAAPNGHVDVTYNLSSERINKEASLAMAKHDALRGKVVCLDYGDHKEFWTKETFATND